MGVFLYKNKSGFASSTCSKMYSSVARLNKMSFDSACSTSIAGSDFGDKKNGHSDVENARCANFNLWLSLLEQIIFYFLIIRKVG